MSQLRGSVDVGTELQSLMSLVSDQRRSARASQLGSGDERAGRSNSRAAATFGAPLPLRDHHSTRMASRISALAARGATENYHQNADLLPTTANQPPPYSATLPPTSPPEGGGGSGGDRTSTVARTAEVSTKLPPPVASTKSGPQTQPHTSGVFTALRLLRPLDDHPCVLPESLLELVTSAPCTPSIVHANRLCSAATELLNGLEAVLPPRSADNELLWSRRRHLLGMKQRFRNNSQEADVFVVTLQNELSVHGEIVSALMRVLPRPDVNDEAAATSSEDQVWRQQLVRRGLFGPGSLRELVTAAGTSIPDSHAQWLRWCSEVKRTPGAAAAAGDVAGMLRCPHPLFTELGLAELHAQCTPGRKSAELWAQFGEVVAARQRRRGKEMWRSMHDKLHLVGMTAQFLFGSRGKEIRQSYAAANEMSTTIEYQDIEDAQLAELEAQNLRCFIHPERRFRTSWDLLVLILLVYVALVIPIRIAFWIEIKPQDTAFMVDVFSDAIFVLDILFNFRTGIFSDSGTLMYTGRDIARAYARSWLAIDVLSCLPVSYTLLIIGSEGGTVRILWHTCCVSPSLGAVSLCVPAS
jgi:hypothetical protein